jgi:2-phospho-L-lactate/phosphoenolpyruvate guanylyltransferase
MHTAAILPVKRFARAKQRLGESVADGMRPRLARAMVSDVLNALSQSPSIELTIVVTGEPSLLDPARDLGALLVEDPVEDGQSAAVALGVERALAEGMDRVLSIPGDCPAIDPAEIESLLGRYAETEVVIVPDRHGTGTNGLLLTPPDAIPPSFGPGSCERHRSLAIAAGVPWRVERPPSLLLDIDTGADLGALRERLSRAPHARASHTSAPHTSAPRTRAVLGLAEHSNVLPAASAGAG